MTMYGAPVSSVPTSRTRATCSLVIFTAARASRAKRATTSGLLERLREQELDGDPRSSCT